MGHIEAANGLLTITDDAAADGGPANDMQAIVDLIALIGGVLKGTADDRNNLTPGQSLPGWLFSEVDTNLIYKRIASGWIPVVDPGTELTAFTQFNFGGGWSGANINGFTGVWYRRLNGILFASGAVQNNGGWNPNSTIMTFPAGFRPPKRWVGTGVECDEGGNLHPQSSTSGVLTFEIHYPVA